VRAVFLLAHIVCRSSGSGCLLALPACCSTFFSTPPFSSFLPFSHSLLFLPFSLLWCVSSRSLTRHSALCEVGGCDGLVVPTSPGSCGAWQSAPIGWHFGPSYTWYKGVGVVRDKMVVVEELMSELALQIRQFPVKAPNHIFECRDRHKIHIL